MSFVEVAHGAVPLDAWNAHSLGLEGNAGLQLSESGSPALWAQHVVPLAPEPEVVEPAPEPVERPVVDEAPQAPERVRCTALNKQGRPCGGYGVLDPDTGAQTDLCVGHWRSTIAAFG